MGVSGYGTASEYLWYREVGRQFHPDVVLLSFYPGNDVRNNSPTLEPTFRPAYGADGSLDHVNAGKVGEDGGGRRGLNRSVAYQYIRKLVLTRQPRSRSGWPTGDCSSAKRFGRYRWRRASRSITAFRQPAAGGLAGRLGPHRGAAGRLPRRGHRGRRATGHHGRHRARAGLSGRLGATAGDISGHARPGLGPERARAAGAQLVRAERRALRRAVAGVPRGARHEPAIALAFRWTLDARRPRAGGRNDGRGPAGVVQ